MTEYDAKLTKDEKLRIDYDYEKFKKTFEDEMSKLGKQLNRWRSLAVT